MFLLAFETSETETVVATPGDLVVHIMADRFYTMGTLGEGGNVPFDRE